MSDNNLPSLRWGILGAGLISSWFVSDLCLERAEATTKHIIQAIGSSSKEKGSAFATKNCPSHTPNVYDNYVGVYNDPDVDIVYIGTPHTLHCENALAAIKAGKHVLCEKPLAINSRDTQIMIDAAREKGVFFMEAVWTRFFPIAKKLHALLHEDKIIGDVASVQVDFGLYMPIGEKDANHRTASRALGAGALLDIGIYSLTWASIVLDAAPKRNRDIEPGLSASMLFYSETDPEKKVDEEVAVVLRYPELKAQAVCTASLLYKKGEEFGQVYGSKGSIAIGGVSASKPGFLVLRVKDAEEKRIDFEVPGIGFHYEADAVAEDIRSGRTQSSVCSWDDTLTIMKRMDAARAICGLVYPQDEQ
ncbi:unnamed protein product [Clonostachys rosea f. rosea IK726]|uniref:D-xylose 1-dehydrogenase (NADP(+), D-xylono-1,5-lactone-forming) n=2 Tax=Bionectria ochroleuca TaxID=29856 RepID=A0A8H7KAY4_BIOOC|nr:unnamed protein product [Clonostachys rosea f. rosea IK726]